MSRLVVTGGGGFIGAYLVKRLVHDGLAPNVEYLDTLGNLESLGSGQQLVDAMGHADGCIIVVKTGK